MRARYTGAQPASPTILSVRPSQQEQEGGTRAYAFVQDVASTWEQYEHFAAALGEGVPAGLILHVAGPTDEGFRIIAIWESEQAWTDFQAERLAPAIAAVGGPARPEPTFRDLRATHIVAGAQGLILATHGGSEAEPQQQRRRSHGNSHPRK